MSTERTGAALVELLNVLVDPTGNGHGSPSLLIRVPPLYHTVSSLKVVSSPSPLVHGRHMYNYVVVVTEMEYLPLTSKCGGHHQQ